MNIESIIEKYLVENEDTKYWEILDKLMKKAGYSDAKSYMYSESDDGFSVEVRDSRTMTIKTRFNISNWVTSQKDANKIWNMLRKKKKFVE